MKGNYFSRGEFVIVENVINRVVAFGNPDADTFTTVRVDEKRGSSWQELIVWDCAEWRSESDEAFEAILGVIAKVAAGVVIQPQPRKDDLRRKALAMRDAGMTSEAVAQKLGVRKMTVAAWLAHRTMGTYKNEEE